MKAIFILVLFISGMLIQPVEAQKAKEIEKLAQLEKEFSQTKALIETNRFKIEIDRVYPQSGKDVSRFNPRGYITVNDSIAEGHLPFFGRAYSLPYGDGGGIDFDALVKDRTVKITDKKKKKIITYQFSVTGKNDVFLISIDFTAGGNCHINLTSNNRTHIAYSGHVTALTEN